MNKQTMKQNIDKETFREIIIKTLDNRIKRLKELQKVFIPDIKNDKAREITLNDNLSRIKELQLLKILLESEVK